MNTKGENAYEKNRNQRKIFLNSWKELKGNCQFERIDSFLWFNQFDILKYENLFAVPQPSKQKERADENLPSLKQTHYFSITRLLFFLFFALLLCDFYRCLTFCCNEIFNLIEFLITDAFYLFQIFD
jgi:hypothetical protein